MEALFIPTLSFWENGNSWYGSLGQARQLTAWLDQQAEVLNKV